MSSHNVLSLTDRALVAYIISMNAGTADDVYPSKRSEDKAFPETVVYSNKARPVEPYCGTYVVSVTIHIRTDPSIGFDETAEAKNEASEARVSATWDVFWADVGSGSEALSAAITAAAQEAGITEFTVISCEVGEMSAGFDEKRNAWTDTLDLEIVCKPS